MSVKPVNVSLHECVISDMKFEKRVILPNRYPFRDYRPFDHDDFLFDLV